MARFQRASSKINVKNLLVVGLFIVGMSASILRPLTALAVATPNNIRAPKVSFTFDDGLQSSFSLAAPTLQARGFTGTNYVTTDCIGMTTAPNDCRADNSLPYMSWDQVIQLRSQYGWEIGSHTVSHPLLASTDEEDQPSALTIDQVRAELTNSKNAITTNSGVAPTAFASPYGDYNPSGNPVLAEIAKLYTSHRGFADTGYNVSYGDGTASTTNFVINDYQNDYLLRTQQVQSGVSVATVKGYVDQAIADNAWLILTFHDITSGVASSDPDDYQYSNADLAQIADYVKQKQVEVINVSDGLVGSPAANNMFSNPSFNDALGAYDRNLPSTTQWTTDSPANVVRDTANHGSTPDATNSVSITAGATGNAHLFSPQVAVDASKTYLFKNFANVTAMNLNAGSELAYYMEEFDSTGAQKAQLQYKGSVYGNNNPLLKSFSFSYTPTAGTVRARLQLVVTANSDTLVYLDNMQLFAKDGSLPVAIPGSDLVAPVISAAVATNLTTTSAAINWITDEAASSQVEYGVTTTYGNLSPTDTNLTTTHSTGLTGLSANTTYQYRVISTDASGNIATSANFSFTTAATTTPTVGSGDINGDGLVDALDLSIVLSSLASPTDPNGGAPTPASGDINSDGVVDVLDLSIILANWSQL